MKRNNLLLLFVLLFALAASTCKKKNYPKDIPKWLKEKIEEMEKDYTKSGVLTKERLCNHVVPRKVEEYSDGSSTYYWIGSSYNGFIIYNYNGQEVCNASSFSSNPCGNYGFGKIFVRKIWSENCK